MIWKTERWSLIAVTAWVSGSTVEAKGTQTPVVVSQRAMTKEPGVKAVTLAFW